MKKLFVPIFVCFLIFLVSCKTEEKSGYNCINSNCVAVSHNALYGTLSDCQTSCADITPPVITLIGPASCDVTLGTVYTDLGATAYDNNDGDLSSSIVIDNPVNVNLKGVYQITYTVSDAVGNTCTKTRTVNVKNSLDGNTGSYSATDDYDMNGTIDYTWTEIIVSSSTVNNQLIFSKFADYTACTLKINVSGGNISYPGSQTYMCGATGSQQNRTFSQLSGTCTSTIITVYYHQVDADGFTTDGVDTYTKQ